MESLDIGGPSVLREDFNDKYSFCNQYNTDLGEFV